jgi:hypothetical protein
MRTGPLAGDTAPELRLMTEIPPDMVEGPLPATLSDYRMFIEEQHVTADQAQQLARAIADTQEQLAATAALEDDVRNGQTFRIPKGLATIERNKLLREASERINAEADQVATDKQAALQGELDARARAILNDEQYEFWLNRDLRDVTYLERFPPVFLASSSP